MASEVSWSGKQPIMYGINAARPSARAASKAASTFSSPASAVTSATGLLQNLCQILVPSPGETDDVVAIAVAVLQQPGDRVGGLQRRDDPLQPRERGEGGERGLVGD